MGLLSRQTSFAVNGVVFGGLITGRVVSLALDGGMNGYGGAIRALFFVDAAGFGLSVGASFLERLSGQAK